MSDDDAPPPPSPPPPPEAGIADEAAATDLGGQPASDDAPLIAGVDPRPPATIAPPDSHVVLERFDPPPVPTGADVAPPVPDGSDIPPPAQEPEPAVAAAPMPDAAVGPGLTDPFGLGAAMDRLTSGSRKTGRAAALVAADRLEAGESVFAAAVGRFQGADAVVAITDRRLLVANDRAWAADVVLVGLGPGLAVQGWADGHNAVLRFERDGKELVVDRIADAEIAREIAGTVRERSGALTRSSPTTHGATAGEAATICSRCGRSSVGRAQPCQG